MNEDNENAKTPQEETALPGKFKSVDALARAYSELEAEFTRRSQKLKAYEEAAGAAEAAMRDPEALYRAVTENKEVRARVVGDYLQSLGGVPLMGANGAGVTAPAVKPVSIAEAGKLALGYFRGQHNH